LVPSHTFIDTAWGVLYVGATPVLCDIEEERANIDLADAEERRDATVKAIIAVHLYGQPAEMAGVMAFAARHRLVVIEDAAQAIGAGVVLVRSAYAAVTASIQQRTSGPLARRDLSSLLMRSSLNACLARGRNPARPLPDSRPTRRRRALFKILEKW
jgi:hypothetical protein